MTTAELALLVSCLALLISGASLWVNSLRPFRLRLSHDTPTFQLYEITPAISGTADGRTWWIPSFDLGLSFYNVGRRPGEVLDVRLVGERQSHRTTTRYVFYPKWIVDFSRFQQNRDRMAWIESAILRDWYPLTLGGHEARDLHVILESERWDNKENGLLALRLEVFSSQSKKWRQCAEYKLEIREDMFGSRSSYSPFDEKLERVRKLDA